MQGGSVLSAWLVRAQTGARLEQDTAYPGWQPDTGSAVLQLTRDVLEQLTGRPPKVRAEAAQRLSSCGAHPAGWARARLCATVTRGRACRAGLSSLLTAAAAPECVLRGGPARCLAGRGAEAGGAPTRGAGGGRWARSTRAWSAGSWAPRCRAWTW